MTEEKKDDLSEQQTFLSDHEELLKTINTKKSEKDAPSEETETAVKPDVKEEEGVAVEVPAEPEEPVAEPEPEPVVEEQPSPVVETVAEPIEEEPEPEPVVEEQPSPSIDSTPIAKAPEAEPAEAKELTDAVETVAKQSAPSKLGGKKKKRKPTYSQRNAEAELRHKELMKQQALEQSEVKEVLVFMKKYAKPASIAVLAICAVVLVGKSIKMQGVKKNAVADTALMQARNATDLQAIIDDYSSTPAAPLALMGLAREKFNSGQVDEAEALYTQFTKQHGDLELADQAQLNIISCKESKGQLGDAHLLYGEFATEHQGSYLVPSAMMGKARCLEALGMLDEAQIAYEDVIVNFPEGGWAQMAEANLKVVMGKKQ